MNNTLKRIGYILLSAVIAIILYTLLHEVGHMIVMLSAGATITDFSILTAHVSADGGDYTNISSMWLHANGALLPVVVSYIYVMLYQKNSAKSFYRIFSYMFCLIPICSTLTWVIIPFAYLQGNAPINEDVTKFLTIFCEKYPPLVVSAIAVALIGIGVVLMVKKRVLLNFIREINPKEITTDEKRND